MELRKDRMQRFQHRSLGHSLELRHNLSRTKPFQLHSLVLRHMLVHRKDLHSQNCKIACSSNLQV